jgi:hypothetical protein
LGLGRISRQNGEAAESAKCFEKAVQNIATAAEQSPDDADYRRYLKEARDELSQITKPSQGKSPGS